MLPTTGYAGAAGPLAIAHRGGAALAPENTLAAFARATALGFRYLETDVRLTRDGELVCFHDERLDRVTEASGPVGRFSLRQLQELRVGGEPICTLREALAAFPAANFTVDLKDQAAIAPLAGVLADPGIAQRVCVAGAWDGWLGQLRDLAPHVHTALGWRSLTGLISSSRTRLPIRWRGAPARYAHVPSRLGRVAIFADGLVARAHAAGVQVIVWTIDDPATMHRLLDVGVDGIITDRPDLLREVFIARGLWEPMAAEPISVG